jgi:rRNA maturation endonuclease Nob1
MLSFSKKERAFTAYWLVEQELPFEVIEEAFTESGGMSGIGSLWLKLKDGKVISLSIGVGGAEQFGSLGASDMVTDMAVKQNAVNNRWVNAINNQLRKNQIEQLGIAKKCKSCKEEMPQGNFKFCPYCGSSI